LCHEGQVKCCEGRLELVLGLVSSLENMERKIKNRSYIYTLVSQYECNQSRFPGMIYPRRRIQYICVPQCAYLAKHVVELTFIHVTSYAI